MRVFLSAGEASGDAYGAEIVKALARQGVFGPQELASAVVREVLDESKGDLRQAERDLFRVYGGERQTSANSEAELVSLVAAEIEAGRIDSGRLLRETLAGLGGRRLRDAGVGLVADSSRWGAVGIVESLLVAPRAIEGYLTAKNVLRISGPGVFIPIDFGYVNIKLARQAKRLGWKVLYFVPPGSWRRTKQGKDLPLVTDDIVCPFPWSAEILNSMGGRAHFFGHPLKQMVKAVEFEDEREGIAVLPGSRLHEVARNLGPIAEAVKGLDGPIKFAVASNLNVNDLEREWEDLGGAPAEFSSDTYRVLKSSRAAVVCSGTATLEAALCGCPTVVVYKLAPWAVLEFYIRRPKFKFVSLPNIILDREVLPELLLHEASPPRIRAALEKLLEEGVDRAAQLTAFEELDQLLGEGDVFGETAKLAIGMSNEISR